MFDYVNVVYWLIALASLLAWARFSTFASQDVHDNLVDQPELQWNVGLVGVMLLMLVVWIVMPMFWLALPVNLGIAGGAILFYNTQRVKALGPGGNLFENISSIIGKAGTEHQKN